MLVLLSPPPPLTPQLSKQKRKFSSFFKSLVIELDKDLYGPDNHLVEVSHPPTPCGQGAPSSPGPAAGVCVCVCVWLSACLCGRFPPPPVCL